MLSKIFVSELYANGINTIILLFCTGIIYGLACWIIHKKSDNEKNIYKLKGRLTYLLAFFLFFCLTRIWVEGFTHLFTVFTLVSAGLVIANKEIIQNLSGWLVINWRGLFSENDYIKILDYAGYVSDIGPLYFKIVQESKTGYNTFTGNIVKVPNSLAMNNIIISRPSKNATLEQQIHWTLPLDEHLCAIKAFIKSAAQDILSKQYPTPLSMRIVKSSHHGRRKSPYIIKTKMLSDDHFLIEVTLSYLCLVDDTDHIYEQINDVVLEKISSLRSQRTPN